eukprot:TRINITY_DN36947_c0_g1_i1.p1 TRINITY_DN36947_c0_g1~~TRINITY_DN36947_c0_g1_i1.p1  ORF type:complete len:218 (-),score=35.48 TRINITY_DN36947_c0_g1_i1:91-744(-)
MFSAEMAVRSDSKRQQMPAVARARLRRLTVTLVLAMLVLLLPTLPWTYSTTLGDFKGRTTRPIGPLVDVFGKVLDQSQIDDRLQLDDRSSSVALYFAGAWCPMCVSFTKKLIKFLERAQKKHVIFVSSDFTAEEYMRHRKKMPMNWLAVPFGSELQMALKKKFQIWGGRERAFGDTRRSGIPALVVLDAQTGDELKFLDAELLGDQALLQWDERSLS